jgi:branched-chain amino acid transport system ATP-binding protein
MHLHRGRDGVDRLLPRRYTAADRVRIEEAGRLLDLVGLEEERIADRPARTLPYGDQRRLEIARALALKPQLLLLDEPAAGMNGAEKERLRALLTQLNGAGLTIFLVDHDIKLVMGVCDHVTVINFGRRIADGPPAEVASNEAVIAAYLGTHRDELPTRPLPASAATITPAATSTAAAPRRVLLDVDRLAVSYGAIRAVEEVTFQVGEGEVVALIGANGAGKTTVLSALSGLLRARGGTARYRDLELTKASPQAIVRAGLVQVPEGREILARLSVEENLSLGGWTRTDRAGVGADIEAMLERFPLLGRRRRLAAGQLSGGEQQMLAIARALIARPRLLLMDEPSLGLAPRLVEEVFSLIEQIRADGITVLLVEQNARGALELADRAYVIETGRVVLSGTGEALRHDPQVQRAYLGT